MFWKRLWVGLVIGVGSCVAVITQADSCSRPWLARVTTTALKPLATGSVAYKPLYQFSHDDQLLAVECDQLQALNDALQANTSGETGLVYLQPDDALLEDDSANAKIFSSAAETGQDFLQTDGFDSLSDASRDCQSVAIAVIDSGVDTTHPGLAQVSFPAQYNAITGETFQRDDYGHGTHVAGLIASAAIDSLPQGACLQASLLPARFLNASGGGRVSDAIAAIRWAVEQGAGVINHSWVVTRNTDALADVLADVDARGIVQVAAAGNYGLNVDSSGGYYPADYSTRLEGLVAVANWDSDAADLYSASNYGLTRVDLAASGTQLRSLAPGNGTQVRTGTSMAAPLVSAAFAMARSENPADSAAMLRARLLAGCQTEDILNDRVRCGGRLDAGHTLTAAAVMISATVAEAGQIRVTGIGLDQIVGWEYWSWVDQSRSALIPETVTDSLALLDMADLPPGRWQLSLAAGGQTTAPYIPVLEAPDNIHISTQPDGFLLSWSNDPAASAVVVEVDMGSGQFTLVDTVLTPISQLAYVTDASDLLRFRLTSQLDYFPSGLMKEGVTLSSAVSALVYANTDDSVWQTLILASAPAGSAPNWEIRLDENSNASALSIDSEVAVISETTGQSLRLGLPENVSQASVRVDYVGSNSVGNDAVGDDSDDKRTAQRYFDLQINDTDVWQLDSGGGYHFELQTYAVDVTSVALTVDGLIDIRVDAVANDGYLYLSLADAAFQFDSLSATADGVAVELVQDKQGGLIRFNGTVQAGQHLQIEPQVRSSTASARHRDQRCFIASVVFRDQRLPLQLLRAYRDQWLMPVPGGAELVGLYYRLSPAVADWLGVHERASQLVGLLLWMLLGSALWLPLIMVLWYRRLEPAAHWPDPLAGNHTPHD